MIAARNEAEHIDAKIRNCLDLEYPADKLEVIISLDAPTDGTEALARRYTDRGVVVLHGPVHQGKAAAINRAVAVARGEVIVFADARQRISRAALRELVANLSEDDSVGAVSGELMLLDRVSGGVEESSDAAGLYWRYEKWIRAMESDVASVVGATGALYAIRPALFTPLPVNTILDDVRIPMQIVLCGKRVVFEPAAKVYDSVACCPEAEFRRKVRTLAGNYQLLAQMPALLLPWRNPVFLQFVSHKVGRLLAPYFLAALLVSNCFLLRDFYLVPFGLQVAWYLSAYAGRVALKTQSPAEMSKPFVFGHR
ncbi:MAG: glycosyltransferase family 2 protein [Acidobacteria bacterium]|nr:glycosyltransferase family 2 protein [Acidobacteriota bacterium]